MSFEKNFSHLKVQLTGPVLTITLDNPENSNAITDSMIASFVEVLAMAEADASVRAIVLTGAGNAFCAGGDIKAMSQKSGMFAGESNELRVRYIQGIQQIPRCMEALSKPVVAAVNGAAIGAGFDLALMCDIRLGCENTRFGETFVKLGLVPGDGGSFFLQRIVGYAKAMELSLTGEILNAEDSKNLGLLSRVCPSQNLLLEAQELAAKIASYPPIAVQMTKKSIKLAYQKDLLHVLELAAAYQGITQRTEDHFKALEAFKNKSIPDYQGK